MRIASAVWALVVVAAAFVEAIWRLGARALDVIPTLNGWQAVVLVLVTALFVWGEGYRALQRRFAPALVARALEPRAGVLAFIAAPLYALALIGAPRKQMIRAWVAIALIIAAVLIVRIMPEPWRGIIDAGVASALTWGLIAIVWQFVRALKSR